MLGGGHFVLWIVIVHLASSCTLLFDEKREGCGDFLGGTQSFYPVADDTVELVDTRGRGNGQPYAGRDQSTTAGITSIEGACDSALSFDAPMAAEQWYVQIDSGSHKVSPLSVDLWVKLAPDIQGARAGIITRDQSHEHDGDFGIWQIQDGGNARIVVRTQSAAEEKYSCSAVLVPDTWHHVAVSIDDGMAVQLFIDGEKVEQIGETVNLNGSLSACQDGSFGAGVDMTTNEWPWIVGASNAGSNPSEPSVNEHFTGGAVDNLRIRHAVFTEKEARAVFASIDEGS